MFLKESDIIKLSQITQYELKSNTNLVSDNPPNKIREEVNLLCWLWEGRSAVQDSSSNPYCILQYISYTKRLKNYL